MVVAGGTGVSMAVLVAPANPPDSTLAKETLRDLRIPSLGRSRPRSNPPRFVGDGAYDPDPWGTS